MNFGALSNFIHRDTPPHPGYPPPDPGRWVGLDLALPQPMSSDASGPTSSNSFPPPPSTLQTHGSYGMGSSKDSPSPPTLQQHQTGLPVSSPIVTVSLSSVTSRAPTFPAHTSASQEAGALLFPLTQSFTFSNSLPFGSKSA